MKSLNKTTIPLLVALVLALVSGGAYSFFFVAMKNKTEATAELLAKTEELSGKESRMTSAVSTLKSESANIDELSRYFIKESEIAAFAKKIEDLGPQSGTTLSIESLDPGLTEKSVPFLSLLIKATGKFSDIERLLVLLENFPGKFEWKTVRLSRDASSVEQAGTAAQKQVSRAPEWRVEVFLTALNFTKE